MENLTIQIFPKGKSYECQIGRPWLVPGAVVLVQPGTEAKEPYVCLVTEKVLRWVRDGNIISEWELCTYMPGGHAAVIWDYWVGRISPTIVEYNLID
jgi:hypothetical protein